MTDGALHDTFRVVGIGLRKRSRAAVSLAFPNARIYGESAADQAEMRTFCSTEGHTTAFVDIPATGKMVHQRTSLLFDQARVRIVALCEECTDDMYDEALRLEFSGAILVASSVDVYRRVAAAVQRGELWVSREYLSKLTRQCLNSPDQLDLSPREIAILKSMLEDSSNQEIADRLFITRETVRWHLKSLYAKLGVSNRDSARQFAKNIVFNRGRFSTGT